MLGDKQSLIGHLTEITAEYFVARLLPTAEPSAPIAVPRNTVPSASTRIARLAD